MDNKLERHFHCVVFADPGSFPLNDLPDLDLFCELACQMVIYCVETDRFVGYFDCVETGMEYFDACLDLFSKLEIPFYWEWSYAEAIELDEALQKIRQGEMYEIY